MCIQAGASVGSQSLGVRKGVYKCALRGLLGAAQDPQMAAALQKAQGTDALQVRHLRVCLEQAVLFVCCIYLIHVYVHVMCLLTLANVMQAFLSTISPEADPELASLANQLAKQLAA